MTAEALVAGDPCPAWCAIDHAKVVGTLASGKPVREAAHRGERATVAYRHRAGTTDVFPRQMHFAGEHPVVVVVDMAMPDAIRLGALSLAALAALVEVLAKATPAEHRKLAAAIRSAATAIGGTS